MQKTETTINLNDFPKELHYIFKGAKVYDSSSNPTMQVLYSDLGYYVKIAEKDKLKKEAEMARLFENMGMGAEVVSYISDDRDYMVTRSPCGCTQRSVLGHHARPPSSLYCSGPLHPLIHFLQLAVPPLGSSFTSLVPS